MRRPAPGRSRPASRKGGGGPRPPRPTKGERPAKPSRDGRRDAARDEGHDPGRAARGASGRGERGQAGRPPAARDRAPRDDNSPVRHAARRAPPVTNDWDEWDDTPPPSAPARTDPPRAAAASRDADVAAQAAATAPKSAGVEMLEVTPAEDGMRLDRWFRGRFPEVTNSYFQKLARTGQVRVESKRCEANTRLESGQQIRVPRIIRVPAVKLPGAKTGVKPPLGMSKADRDFIERMILFEDDSVLVLNKPYGIAVQGGAGNRRNLDALLAGMIDRFGDRPRLVHRLDRDTTGVLLVAKSRNAAAKLGRTFQTRSAAKTYWALVKGVPKPQQGKVEAALVKASGPDGDRVRKAQPGEQDRAMHATTHYSTIDRVAHKCAWVSLKPVTGRQHQLRAHMDLIGCPIVGDNKYEGGTDLPSESIEQKLHLHARRLVIPHPEGGQIDVTAPLPEHMQRTWELLGLDPNRFDAAD